MLGATNIRSCFSGKRNLEKKFISYFFNLFFHVQSLPSHLYHQFWVHPVCIHCIHRNLFFWNCRKNYVTM